MATFIYRSRREELRVLVEAQLALGVVFLTIAVPLALDDALDVGRVGARRRGAGVARRFGSSAGSRSLRVSRCRHSRPLPTS